MRTDEEIIKDICKGLNMKIEDLPKVTLSMMKLAMNIARMDELIKQTK